MWPLPGWWNSNETAGSVAPCIPKEACLGTRDSLCAEGYVGPRCSQCTEGYGKVQSRCVSCESGPESRWLIIVDLAVWLLIFVGLWVVRPVPIVGSIVGLVTCLQQLSSVGASADESFDAFVRRVFSILTLFSGDVAFLRPDCLGRVGFARNFYLQLGYLAVLLAILLAGLGCVHAVSVLRLRIASGGASSERDSPDAVRRRERNAAFARTRLRFSLVVFASFVYYILTRRAVAALTCTRVSGELVLLAAPDVACFKGDHRGVAAVAVVIIVLFTVGFPALLALKVWRALPRLVEPRDPEWIEAWGFHQEPVKSGARNQFLFLLTEVGMNLVLVLCDTVLITNSDARGALLIAFPVALGVAILTLRPYRATMEYAICIVQWAASAMAGTLILVHDGSGDNQVAKVKFLVYSSVCLLLGAVLLISLDVFLITMRDRKLAQSERKREEEMDREKERERKEAFPSKESDRPDTFLSSRQVAFHQSARSMPTLRELMHGSQSSTTNDDGQDSYGYEETEYYSYDDDDDAKK